MILMLMLVIKVTMLTDDERYAPAPRVVSGVSRGKYFAPEDSKAVYKDDPLDDASFRICIASRNPGTVALVSISSAALVIAFATFSAKGWRSICSWRASSRYTCGRDHSPLSDDALTRCHTRLARAQIFPLSAAPRNPIVSIARPRTLPSASPSELRERSSARTLRDGAG